MAEATQKLTEQQRYQVKLALDRTMLAWIRTALSLSTFGFAVVAFFRTMRFVFHEPQAARLHLAAARFGEALLVLGIGAMVVSATSYKRALRLLRRGDTPTLHAWSWSIVVGLLVALLAIAGMWLIVTNGPVQPH